MQGDDRTTRNPYVFVVGCPRSGTTLLQRMLDNHPLLAVANDSHFIPQPIEQVAIGVDPTLTPELVEWVRTYRRIHRLNLPDEVFDQAAESSSYAEFVAAIYSGYGCLRGKSLAGEKTASYVRYLPRLHALFPWVRTIHIIRDGRDVALSTLQWAQGGKGPSKLRLWDEEPVAVCALWWRRNVTAGRHDGQRLGPDHYHEVSYEQLVAHPEERLRELAAFLDLPDAPQMAAYHVGKSDYRRGISSKRAWLPPTPGLRNWRVDMPERDVALFETLAGDVLEELGYPRSTVAPTSAVTDTAVRCQRWWDAQQARRQAKLAAAAPRPTYADH